MASVAEPAAALDAVAVEGLYERHSSRVFGYCLRMLGSREDAEDAAQTTFMQAFGAIRRGAVPRFESAWLLTIAKNVCLARHRAGGRRRQVEVPRDPAYLAEIAPAAEGQGTLDGLVEALGRLPDRQRRALLLREWHGCSYEEIGDELGLSRSAVESLLFRARDNLARELGDRRSWRTIGDLGWIAAALKSALGGGAAAKLATGAAVIAAGVGVTAAAQTETESPRPAPPAVARATADTRPQARPAPARRAVPTKISRPRDRRATAPVPAATARRAPVPTAAAPAAPPAREQPEAPSTTPRPATEAPAAAAQSPPPRPAPADQPTAAPPTVPDPVAVVDEVVQQAPQLPVELPVPAPRELASVPSAQGVEVAAVEVPATPALADLP